MWKSMGIVALRSILDWFKAAFPSRLINADSEERPFEIRPPIVQDLSRAVAQVSLGRICVLAPLRRKRKSLRRCCKIIFFVRLHSCSMFTREMALVECLRQLTESLSIPASNSSGAANGQKFLNIEAITKMRRIAGNEDTAGKPIKFPVSRRCLKLSNIKLNKLKNGTKTRT
ncbi:unnamed protein product [Nesidiocoris tenuis]|uniref:Uncharacterized protein n=1 Tax=Nesidiocoris tenuis TaxID=355587 RepID=A0A6H5GWB8_9HEMI|nr:unnamed protein product [Nesidiocoris tenuis]